MSIKNCQLNLRGCKNRLTQLIENAKQKHVEIDANFQNYTKIEALRAKITVLKGTELKIGRALIDLTQDLNRYTEMLQKRMTTNDAFIKFLENEDIIGAKLDAEEFLDRISIELFEKTSDKDGLLKNSRLPDADQKEVGQEKTVDSLCTLEKTSDDTSPANKCEKIYKTLENKKSDEILDTQNTINKTLADKTIFSGGRAICGSAHSQPKISTKKKRRKTEKNEQIDAQKTKQKTRNFRSTRRSSKNPKKKTNKLIKKSVRKAALYSELPAPWRSNLLESSHNKIQPTNSMKRTRKWQKILMMYPTKKKKKLERNTTIKQKFIIQTTFN